MSSNRLRLLLVSVMAVVAISAVASASASAAVTCYPVAEEKTGNFETSTKCEKKEEKAASEWVSIEKLEKEVAPGVWCAKVKVKETGNYATVKTCEEGKTRVAKSEFIRVKLSRDEWEVCEEGGTEKFENHKCAKKSETGKWSWKVLAAGEKRKVISEGKEFKLKAGTLTVTCKKVTDKGTITGGKPGTDLAEEIKFTECTTGEAGCEVRSSDKPAFGTINVTNIPTKLEQVTVGEEEIEVDLFESKTVENKEKEKEKEFVTLEFNGASCAKPGYVTTKVKGNVAAETVPGTGELNFPSAAITAADTLNAFGVSATLTGKDTQEVITGTEKFGEGWAVRAV